MFFDKMKGEEILTKKELTVKPKKLLPLTSDIVFKRVFSREENKDLLKNILEAILKIKIEKIEIKNPELPRDMADSKAGVLDIRAMVNEDTIIDIEIQMKNEHNIIERSTKYLTTMSNEVLKRGEDYTKLKQSIVINILNFNYLERNSYLNIAHMKFEESTPETYINMGYIKESELATEKLKMVFIEIQKFIKKNPEADTELNQWIWLLAGRREKLEMAEKVCENVEKALKIIEDMSIDPKEWELYESRQKAIFNYETSMYNVREEGIKIRRKESSKKFI